MSGEAASGPSRDGVFVLGAGPMATSLAGALTGAGVAVKGLWARRLEAAETAGRIAGVPAFSGAWPAVLQSASVLIFAVRDDAITSLAEQMAADGQLSGEHVLLHCAGSQSAEGLLGGVPARGRGLMHPLRAIVDPEQAIGLLATTTFGIEGDPVGLGTARELCQKLGAPFLPLRADQMAAYHAAAAIASNYLVSLIDLAHEVLASAGIDETAAGPAFADLAQGALENLRLQGLPRALSGPIRRGDARTVAAHLAALEQGPRSNADLYRQLALRSVSLSRRCGDASARELSEIAALLSDSVDADPPIE